MVQLDGELCLASLWYEDGSEASVHSLGLVPQLPDQRLQTSSKPNHPWENLHLLAVGEGVFVVLLMAAHVCLPVTRLALEHLPFSTPRHQDCVDGRGAIVVLEDFACRRPVEKHLGYEERRAVDAE